MPLYDTMNPMQIPVIAYTDGACRYNPGPAGLGVVIKLDGEAWEYAEYLGEGTNNIAELSGIMRAAERVAAVYPGQGCVIHTDSTYAIGVLSKGWRAKANIDLIRHVQNALASVPNWSLRYVPGHSGVAENEYADKLATAAAKTKMGFAWRLRGPGQNLLPL